MSAWTSRPCSSGVRSRPDASSGPRSFWRPTRDRRMKRLRGTSLSAPRRSTGPNTRFLVEADDVLGGRGLVIDLQHIIPLLAERVVLRRQPHGLPIAVAGGRLEEHAR